MGKICECGKCVEVLAGLGGFNGGGFSVVRSFSCILDGGGFSVVWSF